MTEPLDVQRNLDHCMLHIKGASQAMAEDMYEAAMKLGAAEMMLASASNAVRRRAAPPAQGPMPPGTGEELGAEGS
jgi:hypothetical protein